jgi:hypothetical protein
MKTKRFTWEPTTRGYAISDVSECVSMVGSDVYKCLPKHACTQIAFEKLKKTLKYSEAA